MSGLVPIARDGAFERALGRLRRELADPALAPGARLPPEREMVRRLGCSRQTLRRCYAVLESEGLIWRHVGQGTFAGPPPVTAELPAGWPLERAAPGDLLAARLLLEPQIAAAAALAADAAAVARLRRCVERGRAAPDWRACERADADFHFAVARATGNPVLVGFLDFLAGARRRADWQWEWSRTYRRIGDAAFRGPHSDQHVAVVDAIEAGDSAAAETAMRAHLTTIREAMRG
ncbi:MAG TPA: FCD domain-containing protein [Alphaproteobacteria bacterium]|nr:FCD domain-containing protein [Alphaproteobacteria bacterium]